MSELLSQYKKKFGQDMFAKTSGIELLDAFPGYAKASMKVCDNHLNSVGVVHGGAIFTLADFAFAVASNSNGRMVLGINAEISFFKALKMGTLTAEAKEISINASGAYQCSKLQEYLDNRIVEL